MQRVCNPSTGGQSFGKCLSLEGARASSAQAKTKHVCIPLHSCLASLNRDLSAVKTVLLYWQVLTSPSVIFYGACLPPYLQGRGPTEPAHPRKGSAEAVWGPQRAMCLVFFSEKRWHNTPPLVNAGAISWHFSVLPWGFLCTTWRRGRCTENSAAPLLGLCIVFQVLPSSKEMGVFFQRFGHLACSVAASWLLCTAALAWLTTQGSKQSTSSLLTPWQHPAPQTAKDGAEAGRTLIPLGCTQLQPEEGVGATTTGGFQMTAPRASHRRPWDTESEHLEISKCTAYIYSGCKGLRPKGHSLFCSIIMRGE